MCMNSKKRALLIPKNYFFSLFSPTSQLAAALFFLCIKISICFSSLFLFPFSFPSKNQTTEMTPVNGNSK